MSSQPSHDNILYLDFDGTLTGVLGGTIFGTGFCDKFKDLKQYEQRKQHQHLYNEAGTNVKITPEAKAFLNQMTNLYPQVKIVIISRNYENYIRALLEFEEIDTSTITIYSRSKDRSSLGLGERKFDAVKYHETLVRPGLRLICDDTETDCDEMISGASRIGNRLYSHSFQPGEFKWKDYALEVKDNIRLAQPEASNGNGKSYMQSLSLFSPTKTGLAAGAGLATGVGAILAAVLISVSNPITFGLAVGLLSSISIGALLYAGAGIYQNYNNEESLHSEYTSI